MQSSPKAMFKHARPSLRLLPVLCLLVAIGLHSGPALAATPTASGARLAPPSNPAATSARVAAPAPAAVSPVHPAAVPNPVPVDNRNSLYSLDGFGGVHAAGSSPALTTSAYWQGWDIARSLAILPDGSGGYVLDGFGGLHPVGHAPPVTAGAYWQGWDIARQVVLAPWLLPGASPQGWVLDGWGGIHAFGGAPDVATPGYWRGWDIARSLVVTPDSTPLGVSGYLLDGFGGLHAFGHAPARSAGYWQGWDIARSVALVPTSTSANPGGYLLDGWGGVHPFGSAPAVSTSAYWQGWDIAKSVVAWSGTGTGGWVLDGWGGIHQFGSAPAVNAGAYWQGWDIARSLGGAGQGTAGRPLPPRPTSRVLNLPYYHQTHSLDCEAAALQMALTNRGIFVSQDAILGAIGIDSRPPVRSVTGFHWGDPYAAFVGNPDGSENNYTGYGVYYPPIARVAGQYGDQVLMAGENISPQAIYSAVLDGHPVVAWTTWDWSPHGTSYYLAFDGRWVHFAAPWEHAVTVVGVSPTAVLVNNPLAGPQWISRGQFEASYGVLGNMAVVLS